jgi:hypothetical protein
MFDESSASFLSACAARILAVMLAERFQIF